MHGSPPSRGTPARRGRSPRSSTASPGGIALPVPNSAKPPNTFTTCLSISVEGAVPIERLEITSANGNGDASAQASGSDSKRAPRKSKTDAIAALQSHAQSSGQEDLADMVNEDGAIQINLREGPPIPVKPALDMSTVKTPNRQWEAPQNVERPFGLTDCPVFRPTLEQFKDPLAYIKSISEKAKAYGMCKIVPPLGWEMPFVTDTERFRFKTRLQRLNSIEASSRAKVNYLEQLYRFHKQQGNPRVVVPTINHKPLDLWLLRKEVQKQGGYEMVTRNKKWADLGRLLGYSGIPGLSTQMKNSYTRVILPYEHYRERVSKSSTVSPNKPRDSQLNTNTNIQTAGKLRRLSATSAGDDNDSPPPSPLTVTSSPLSDPSDEGESKNAGRGRVAVARMRRNTRHSPHDQSACFHMFCLDPPLTTIPKGQWFCHTCLCGTGADFGFDEGEEHSLSSFQARDLEFRRQWFKRHPPAGRQGNDDGDVKMAAPLDPDDPRINVFDDVVVTETDVENEFWRLVQSQHETVEVEYGADVHSTTHGSGMPTLETHPLESSSKDPWNLNNIPILPDSLLRYIKSDISGMTVPWTYVGMVFSTFCWHNEDHYTYSINYMHWGETKTWYSIPGADADKFEAAIRREAPDLFEVQPDLLFQLVTLMNPNRIRDAGVDVYACNQRAGEFVITFPKAYHAGFNHGLNFNEAVNFALPDWLPFDLDCVRRYQEHRKLPVFSHDELLITITQQNQSIQTALWLNDNLQEMMVRERRIRDKARSLGLKDRPEKTDRPEDQYQCSFCKVFCYLSQITCDCTTKVVCVDHIDELCKCPMTNRYLRLRFDDTEIQDIQMKVSDRAAIPSTWRAKLDRLLMESARPSLRSLRALMAEGERINYPLSELHALRKCVVRANEWVDTANSFLIRKVSRKRARKSRGRTSGPSGEITGEEVTDKPERTLDELYTALSEVEDLGFDCQEINALKALANEAQKTREKARALHRPSSAARDREAFVQECERLLIEGSTLNVLVDELVEIEKIVSREQLLKELEEELEDGQLSLEDIRQFAARASQCELSTDNPQMVVLSRMLHAGEEWEARVKDVLGRPLKTVEELDETAQGRSSVPVDVELVDRLVATLVRAKDYEKQAKAWLMPEPNAVKPKVQEAAKLVTRAEKDFNIPAVQDLKRTVDFALDLEARCDAVLKNRYEHTDEGDIFQTMLQWRKYAKEHLTMFTLLNFDKLDKQLVQHARWLEGLPWYCRQHQEAHGQAILEDVIESTRPEDDLPPNDEYFTCICTTPVRPPAAGTVSDAVQCDHCFARFHGVCAANGGSCPFCDHHHWNGTIHKERSWHWCYLPTILMHAPDVTKNYSEDWKQLEIIVHRVDRLSQVIGQFLSFASQPVNQRADYIPQVRHYMRKLYRIQFAVSPNPEVSFGLDLAGLHRILAGQPAPVRVKKRRRPKFTFGQDVDKDWTDGTRCICRGRTPYLAGYHPVECELCSKLYHAGCVFYPLDPMNATRPRFMCPLCCIRKNRAYPYSEVRVRHIDNPAQEMYVDTREMLETFSKDMIYMRLPPPYTQTLFIELIRFVPGVPENVGPRKLSPSTPPVVIENGRGPSSTGASNPPPPPWTNQLWSNAGATAPPPLARPPDHLRSPHPSSHITPQATPQPSRKRKYPDEMPPPDERVPPVPYSPAPRSPKRRQASHTPQPAPRTSQGLSPSLAMMLSPNPVDTHGPNYVLRLFRSDLRRESSSLGL
ncbi:hypothetical protein IEO21_05109 [Rhodonia placenta]|uniref:[histone H3]-trimethyl-L-lysine(4) demethylase n=1 Tax=Rhodonia placenta TaxID=104341 RepID=A0A8H7P2G9_9APHY|nr:hypothetical protein IEO21_05109 [Postia placenta]